MLDLITQSQIWNFLLEEIDRRGLGLLAVTHSDPLMAKVAARVMELESPEGGFRESDGDDP